MLRSGQVGDFDPLAGLNFVSPAASNETSPQNGTTDAARRNAWDLSAPVDANRVAASLDSWASVAFDFQSFVGGPPPVFDRAFDRPSALDATGADGTASYAPEDASLSPYDAPGLHHLPISMPNPLTVQPASISAVQSFGSPNTPISSTSSADPIGEGSAHIGAHTTGVGTDGQAAELGDEEDNRKALEEDKRRRNTAASARFRVKKKQREQALEQTAKELRERVVILEKEVDSLKSQNGWLRNLVLERGGDITKRLYEEMPMEEAEGGKRVKAEA